MSNASIILNNIVPNSSFEQEGSWIGQRSSEHSLFGSYSIQLTGTEATPEITVQTSVGIPLSSSHIYYLRIYGYQETQAGPSVGFYWPISEPSFKEAIPIGPAGQWNLYSEINNRVQFTDGEYPLRLDFNNSYIPGTIFFDGVMLIDLTASFGAGNEPTKEWMDLNIPYFNGTYTYEYNQNMFVKVDGAWWPVTGIYTKTNNTW